jgi:hypothetical protein
MPFVVQMELVAQTELVAQVELVAHTELDPAIPLTSFATAAPHIELVPEVPREAQTEVWLSLDLGFRSSRLFSFPTRCRLELPLGQTAPNDRL